mmetsp:Transcript_30040/g.82458  ORF Transcript_30040/g.82458 Transcript_30040/m.82458 type:complete len:254 (-) Transcript_30040:247-1008(-)
MPPPISALAKSALTTPCATSMLSPKGRMVTSQSGRRDASHCGSRAPMRTKAMGRSSVSPPTMRDRCLSRYCKNINSFATRTRTLPCDDKRLSKLMCGKSRPRSGHAQRKALQRIHKHCLCVQSTLRVDVDPSITTGTCGKNCSKRRASSQAKGSTSAKNFSHPNDARARWRHPKFSLRVQPPRSIASLSSRRDRALRASRATLSTGAGSAAEGTLSACALQAGSRPRESICAFELMAGARVRNPDGANATGRY